MGPHRSVDRPSPSRDRRFQSPAVHLGRALPTAPARADRPRPPHNRQGLNGSRSPCLSRGWPAAKASSPLDGRPLTGYRTDVRTEARLRGPSPRACGRLPGSGYARNPVPHDTIEIRGAREHNLKNIDLSLPRDRLIVLTGLSGSGKSSLAIDTIYAEGQRRYVESLSAYARQFLGQMEKPDVDTIEGLSPAISIDQKGTSKNPRSTVGTITEVYDYLRLLYARVGVPHCPVCGREVRRQTVDQMADHVEKLPTGTRVMVLGPVVKGRKGEYRSLIEDVRKSGFVRVRVDGSLYELGEQIPLDKNKKHDIQVVVDRIVVGPDQRSRLAESIETAARLGGGLVLIAPENGDEIQMSMDFACPYDGTSVPEPEPRNFSFNSPHG